MLTFGITGSLANFNLNVTDVEFVSLRHRHVRLDQRVGGQDRFDVGELLKPSAFKIK